MKIRILKKNIKEMGAIIGVINLSKAVCVRVYQKENSVSLDVFNPGIALPMSFPESKFTFEEVQISPTGKVSYVKRTIAEIISLYEVFG